MNRRSFLKNSALALFGFTVLPPAETYQRVWRATRPPLFCNSYDNNELGRRFICAFFFGEAIDQAKVPMVSDARLNYTSHRCEDLAAMLLKRKITSLQNA